jgi:4-amino-4-deoxy-L-arabinose transferase-like glycosyltransferase
LRIEGCAVGWLGYNPQIAFFVTKLFDFFNRHLVPASVQLDTEARKWLRWSYLLIGGLLVFRLGYIASGLIELSPDEALYWLQSKHPALSFYSKPPLTAFTMWVGTGIWGDNAFGVRFFSPVIAALISLMCLRFCAREINVRTGFIIVLITNATPLLMAGSNLMTIDPLSVLFWTAAMFAGWSAIQTTGTTRNWLWVGLWMGLGFLSKYTELFQFLCWAVFFCLWKPARVHLRRPGPYLALLVNALIALPVLIWNAQHDWVTVTHVGGRGDFGHEFNFTTRYLIDFIGSEAGLLNPVFFLGMLLAVVAFWRAKPRDWRMIYFFSMGAPLVFGYLLQSLHARVLPNWIAPAVLPLFFVTVLFWDQYRERPWLRRTFCTGLGIGIAAMVFLTDTDVTKVVAGRYLPPAKDPLHRVRGWQETARALGEARQNLLKEGKPVFIICPGYGTTSELEFYLPEARTAPANKPLACCWGADVPVTEFYFWPEYRIRDRIGDNAIFFNLIPLAPGQTEATPAMESPPDTDLVRQFRSVKNIGIFHSEFRGRAIRWFQVFECRDLLKLDEKPAAGLP